jgi:hypothetical protein
MASARHGDARRAFRDGNGWNNSSGQKNAPGWNETPAMALGIMQ